MEKQFSLLIALDIKRQFNKAASSYIIFTPVVCITNIDTLKCFSIKLAFPRSWYNLTFLPPFCFYTAIYGKLECFSGSLSDQFEQPGAEHHGIFTHTKKTKQTRKA